MSGIISKFLTNQNLGSKTISRGIYSAAILTYFLNKYLTQKNSKRFESEDDEIAAKAEQIAYKNKKLDRKKNDPTINKEFFINLRLILKIILPRLQCKESGVLILHTLALVTRTFLSIHVATLEGRMVKYIVEKDGRNFAWMMINWFGVAVPATFINSLIKYLESQLALAFRTRLVDHTYKLYFKNQTFYRASNLDSRIENADHCLTDDINVFTNSIARLYSHISKPMLDSVMILTQLVRITRQQRSNSTAGPIILILAIVLTGTILKFVSPKFGKLVAEEANRKGYLRYVHSRIITNAEEIAFYLGEEVEHKALKKAYNRLVKQSSKIFDQRLWYIMIEQFLMKYGWAGTGMMVNAIPILTGKSGTNSNISDRTEYYTTAKNLLVSGGDAMERLMNAYKEVVELAGYTDRVAKMIYVFEDCSKGKYHKKIATNAKNKENIGSFNLEFKNGFPEIKGIIIESKDGTMELKDVPIVTPNCDVVVTKLNLKVKPGMHLIITGPNGCGKSSLFRIISGLWPVYGGTLIKPPLNTLFYIPQRPYMSIGSLRDQVIYPESVEQMKKRNITDSDLENILEIVNLKHIVEREGGWSSVGDWKDILSGGEKQRMGMARLFYHKPTFALLDECTSAVSIDVEGKMYQTAKDMNVTLLTITHRPSLWKFHSHLLKFDGEGGWNLSLLDKEKLDQSLVKVN